jgi:phage-related minor tail protein
MMDRETLKTLKIEAEQFLEQLATGEKVGAADDDRFVSSVPDFNFTPDTNATNEAIKTMLARGSDAGCVVTMMDEMR